MKQLSEVIQNLVQQALPQLQQMQGEAVRQRPGPDEWSKQEILGHLIDSTANNHQRIVRAAYQAAETFPPYSQTDWVRLQHYQEADWANLVELWAAYNRQFCFIIEHLPPEALQAPCNIGCEQPVSLALVIEDYPRHMQHHINEILK